MIKVDLLSFLWSRLHGFYGWWLKTCSSSGLPSSRCKKSVHPGRLQHLFMTTCSASDLVETPETRENPWRLEELVETRRTRRAGEGVVGGGGRWGSRGGRPPPTSPPTLRPDSTQTPPWLHPCGHFRNYDAKGTTNLFLFI